MRSQLCGSSPDSDFVKKLDQREYERTKTLLLAVYAEGKPERVAKMIAAKTLTEMRLVFIEMVDENTSG